MVVAKTSVCFFKRSKCYMTHIFLFNVHFVSLQCMLMKLINDDTDDVLSM